MDAGVWEGPAAAVAPSEPCRLPLQGWCTVPSSPERWLRPQLQAGFSRDSEPGRPSCILPLCLGRGRALQLMGDSFESTQGWPPLFKTEATPVCFVPPSPPGTSPGLLLSEPGLLPSLPASRPHAFH